MYEWTFGSGFHQTLKSEPSALTASLCSVIQLSLVTHNPLLDPLSRAIHQPSSCKERKILRHFAGVSEQYHANQFHLPKTSRRSHFWYMYVLRFKHYGFTSAYSALYLHKYLVIYIWIVWCFLSWNQHNVFPIFSWFCAQLADEHCGQKSPRSVANLMTVYEVWGLHAGDSEDFWLPECEIVPCDRISPTYGGVCCIDRQGPGVHVV
jgi:hypothetical protein